MSKNINDAVIFWSNLLDTEITYQGPTPSLSEKGYGMIADVLEQKKVGRWDELMSESELSKLKSEPFVLNDVAELINSWHTNTNESADFITPPTEFEVEQSLYRLVSQIFKTLKVKQDEPKEEEEVKVA